MAEISAPKVTRDSRDKLLHKMYISNVAKRLRELNQPTDIDRKRWIWELIQNAKDTIVGDPSRTSINVRIDIDGDVVKFRHDGAPFTSDARFGLLYKFSEDKENQESTGRFGTGFLTTHCLSKTVSIESNMYGDGDSVVGFSVTMYRDGQTEKELLEGVMKMEESSKYYSETFDWTTYTYHVNSESGKRAIALGKENFFENIAQTMLFCKELASVELNDNGKCTKIIRGEEADVENGIKKACFSIRNNEEEETRYFLYKSYSEFSDDLTKKYKADRFLRFDVAIEVDEENNIVSHDGKTSHFCVLPLVGIESQLNEPFIINSPDFEPDSERQSLLLTGLVFNQESNAISENGVNRLIYEKAPIIAEDIVKYISTNKFGCLYHLCNGLKAPKTHEKLDQEWYKESVIKKYRDILKKYHFIKPYQGEEYLGLDEIIVVNEKEFKKDNQALAFKLLSNLYPDNLVADNDKWSKVLWSSDIKLWKIGDICKEIEEKKNWNQITLSEGTELKDWYNEFLGLVVSENELLLKDYALLPNMLGDLLKRDATDFSQGENLSDFVINLLANLGFDKRPSLLHSDITAVSLGSKFNSHSFSSKANNLAKDIINRYGLGDSERLKKLLPLISIIPTEAKGSIDEAFIQKRKDFFNIAKDLFSSLSNGPDGEKVSVLPTGLEKTTDSSLLKETWEETDRWFVSYVLWFINIRGSLDKLPNNLTAKWLSDCLVSLNVSTVKLNEVAVLPNQRGAFLKHEQLYKDSGVSEELKDDIFNNIGLSYKSILLHKDIDAAKLSITKSKSNAGFASDLSLKFNSQQYYFPGAYSIGGRYYKYPIEVYNKISHYLVQLMPMDKECETFKKQVNIKYVAQAFLGDCCKGCEAFIDCSSNDLWKDSNDFIYKEINSDFGNWETIDKSIKALNISGESDYFDLLNKYYSVLSVDNKLNTALTIYPNQHGIYKKLSELKKEASAINDILKDIIALLVPEAEEYRTLLLHNKCNIPLSATINTEDAYRLIDNKVYEFYQMPAKWQEEDFKKATHLLINEWGENNPQFCAQQFPKVYPIKDSIVLNVVYTIEDRRQLQAIKNGLSEDEFKELIDNLPAFKKMLAKKNDSQEDDVDVSVYETQEGNSRQEQIDFNNEAKAVVKEYLLQTYPNQINYDSATDNYSLVNGVTFNGAQLPMVVKSYKYQDAPLKINPSEWLQLIRANSMLLLHVGNGVVKTAKMSELLRKQGNVSFSFTASNFANPQRITEFSKVMHYFSEMRFHFRNVETSRVATLEEFGLDRRNPNSFDDLSPDSFID